MKDKNKEQLANEPEKMRQRIAQLEKEVTERKQAEEELQKSELRYRLLTENVTDVIWTMDMNLRFTYISPSVTRRYGYSIEEAMAIPIEENLTPSSFKAAMKVFKEEMAIEKMEKKDLFRPRTLEVEQYRKDGSTLWSELEIAFLRDADGQAIGIVGVTRDITERKRVEKELQESEGFLHSVFDAIQDGISVLDCDLNVVRVNSWIEKMYASEMPLVGKKCYTVYQNRESPCPWCPSIPTIETGEAHTETVPYPSTEKPTGWIDLTAFPIKDAHGRLVGIIEHVKDVTDRKRAEEALRGSEERFRTVADFAYDWECWIGIDGNAVYVSPSCERITGHNADEFLLDPELLFKITHPDDRDMVSSHILKEMQSDEVYSLEFRVITGRGEERWIAHICQPVYGSDGSPLGRRSSNRDITERKRAEEELARAEAYLKHSLASTPDGVVLLDKEGKTSYVNTAFLKWLGRSADDFIGKTILEISPPIMTSETTRAIAEKVKMRLETGGAVSGVEIELIDKDGKKIPVSYSASEIRDDKGNILGEVGFIRDITERKRAEEELRESEERFHSISDTANEAIVSIDSRGNIVYWNKAAETIFGYRADELAGKSVVVVMPEQRRDLFISGLKEMSPTGATGLMDKTFEQIGLRKDGSEFPAEISLATWKSKGDSYFTAIVRDTTERKRAEEALRESEEKYRLLVDNLNEALTAYDSNGLILFINVTGAKNLGSMPEDIVGKSLYDFFPDTADVYVERARRVFVSGVGLEFEDEVPLPSGNRWFYSNIQPVKDTSGKVVSVQNISYEITERKKAEQEKLQAVTERAAVIDAMGDGLITIGMDGKILSMNPAFERLSGFEEDEFKNKDAASLMTRFIKPEEQESLSDLFGASLKGDIPGSEIFTLLDQEGREIPIFATASFIPDEEGKPVTMIIMLKDITDIRQAEEELKESEEKLRAMFESITDGIVVTNLQGKITDVNDVIVHMSGLSREEIIGQDGFALLPREDRDKIVEEGKRVIKQDTGLGRRVYEVSPNVGSSSTTNLILGTMHDSDGNPTGFVAIAQDFTERKQMEEERERLHAELEDKSEELEQLVFIASHDLRSPLVNIQGFAREIEQSLQEVRLSLEGEDIPSTLKEKLAASIGEDIADSLNYILTSSSKIDSMLAGLLKVSRLGKVSLTIEKLNMKDLMAEVVGVFEFQTREAGVKLEVERLPQCLGDRAQLNQVFSNLIDNALKFFDPERPGIIRISGRKEKRQIVYTVEDNGVGIAPENQKTVFQIFRRFSPMDTPGEGLGLNIVRRILDRHGGKIWLESEQGKGSRFHVALPIR